MAATLMKRARQWALKTVRDALQPGKKGLVTARELPARARRVTVVGLGGNDKAFVQGYQAIFGKPR